MLDFTKLPSEKPNNNTVAEGRYTAVVFKNEMRKGKENNNEYLNVSFKLDKGGFVNENYFDSDKPFVMYKLGRLLKACNVALDGEGTLKDVAKLINGKRVIVDVVVNDKGYGALDYSGNNEGIYAIGEVEVDTEVSMNDAPVLDQAIETELSDELF